MTMLYRLLRRIGIRTHRGFRLLLRGAALSAALLCGYYVNQLFEQSEFIKVIPWYLGVGLAALLEFILADVLADQSFPFDTERKLLLIEQQVGKRAINEIRDQLTSTIERFQACDRSKIAATLHLLTELLPTLDERRREGLLQVTDYVGAKEGGKGRLTAITKGIIGACVRTGKLETVNFASADDYRESMVQAFGYTNDEVLQHSAAARSYLAFPLRFKKDGPILGVVFFFSTEPQVFPRGASPVEIEKTADNVVALLRVGGLV